MEQWKMIDENNKYEISNIGRLRNIKTQRILKLGKNTDGYIIYPINVNSKMKSFLISRLVGKYFVKKDNDEYERVEINNRL